MGSDTPVAGLGGPLFALLLSTLLWAALAGLLVSVAVYLLVTHDGPVVQRGRGLLFGVPAGDEREPRARRFLRIVFGLLWVVDGLLQAQPQMPGGFVANIVEPGASSAPGWFGAVVGPLVRAWTRHPVAADAATVWVQVGIGLLILIGGRGLLAKAALYGSLLWSVVVWIPGEAFGGLLSSGVSWLTGAPGAVLVYAAAGGLLLLPWQWWESGRAATLARRFGAVWLLVGAVLQSLPVEQNWTAGGISGMFVSGAAMRQPAALAWPIQRLASVSADHPAAVNSTIIVLLLAAAAGLWVSGRVAAIAAAILLCAATWWLAQDFGVLGGTATDPNAALPLGLLVAAALPGWARAAQPAPVAVAIQQKAPRARRSVVAGLVTFSFGLALVAPVVLTSTLGTPADAAAIAADSDGGLRLIAPRPAVPFSLTDQRGQRVSTSSLTGKLVVLTFLDPVCTTDCPVVANQMAIADQELGALAQRVQFVAIDVNPVFRYAADVAAFTQSHGLGELPNWHFLYGPPEAVQNLLAAYSITIDVPAVGMVQHSEGMYFITPHARQAAYLDDGANNQLTDTYADQIRDAVRTLLK